MKTLPFPAALALLALVVPARAAKPVPTRPLSYQIPYRLTIPKHILVRAKINGKGPYNFILDTGAPALFVSTALCKKLGISGDQNHWGTFDRFEIEGGLVLRKTRGRVETPFQLEGMNGMGLAGAEVHGIIGYNILARYRMEIDFTRDKMTWTVLDFVPRAPLGLGARRGASGGLEVVGSMMKMLGSFLGRQSEPELRLRGFLGLELADGDENPVIRSVLARGPAALAGVQAGDQLTHFQGRTVQNSDDVRRFARRLVPGAPVKLTVRRGQDKKEITFKTGEGL